MSSSKKFVADAIAKAFIHNEEEDEDSYSDEAYQFDKEKEFNPSTLRRDAIPTEGDYAGKVVGREELENDVTDSEEEDDDQIYDSDDLGPMPEPDEVHDIEDELDKLDQDDSGLLDSLRHQQEADLKIADGTDALQNQYNVLLALRIKLQNVLTAATVLPPTSIPDSNANPYEIAKEDPEVAELMSEVSQSLSVLHDDLHDITKQLETMYEWNEEEVADDMMEIIGHWGAKLRLSGGMKHGSVINRPIEQQIESALLDKQSLVQPSRHRNADIFGLEQQPEIHNQFYNDSDWYNRMLHDFVSEKKPEARFSKVSDKPKTHTLKSRQINYDVIEQLRGFMSATMKPIPDDCDALFNSLMK